MPPGEGTPSKAVLRPWKPGDRVRLRYSSGPRKVKEVLERMKVNGEERTRWPVLEAAGHILWMRGVEVEPDPAIQVAVDPLGTAAEGAAQRSHPPSAIRPD